MLQQPEEFMNHPRVAACLDKLKNKFNSTNPLIVSDVIDDQGHQYAHLVQKGGGVLGVALVGYTYILEMMRIRFLKQAGTSAGAINTALMTVVGSKQDMKSTKILKAICDLDFFSLVDGHPFARKIIKSFITDGNFVKRIKNQLLFVSIWIAILIATDFLLLGLQHKYPSLKTWTIISFALTTITLGFITGIVLYAKNLIKRLKNAGYGINPGDFFYDWIKKLFKENGVVTVSDLNNKASEKINGLKNRHAHPKNLEGLDGSVTFIASELSNKNKIQFPEMCYLFRKKEDIDKLSPAGFVRASMAIPVFFESYIINDIPCTDDEIKKAWGHCFNGQEPPSCARFVDGGILSNFPIDLFYNPSVEVPRLPVFGIDLDDSTPGDKGKNAEKWSFGGYMSRMFLTIQNHSDKQFLLKNKVYGYGVGKIKVAGYNWLNFFMPPKKKIELFVLGAEAATEFLLNFNWEQYKKDRTQMQQQLS